MRGQKFKAGDHVLSAPGCDYPCLLGVITEIRKADDPEKDTENEGDDIYCDFWNAYGPEREKALDTHFQDLYDDPDKTFDDVPIDMVIMDADELVVLSERELTEHQDQILQSGTYAAEIFAKHANAACDALEQAVGKVCRFCGKQEGCEGCPVMECTDGIRETREFLESL